MSGAEHGEREALKSSVNVNKNGKHAPPYISSSGSGTTPSSGETVPTQEVSQSQEDFVTLKDGKVTWGVLYPIDPRFYPIELQDDVYTFGRGEDCSYSFDVPSIRKTSYFKQYSKLHFTIKRTYGSSHAHTVMLIDASMNGVFVNGEKIPSKQTRPLCSKDEISIAVDKNRVFFFFDKTQEEDPNLPKIFNEKYIMHKIIGSGAYGEVRIAMSKFGNEQHAVKIINKQRTIFGSKDQEKAYEQILKEAKLLLSFQHPFIIRVHDVLDSKQNLYIVLELAPGGDLYQRVLTKQLLGEDISKLVLLQMANAVSYLHGRNVSHRDLKPENILMMSEDDECLIKATQFLTLLLHMPHGKKNPMAFKTADSVRLKMILQGRTVQDITDFGVSRLVEETSFMRTQAGTPSYLAPELINTMKGLNRGYTKRVDCWSMGVILYVCLVGYPPFLRDRKDTNQDLLQQILGGNYNFNHARWSVISEEAKDLVRKLLEIDPEKRLSSDQCLQHGWLNDDNAKHKVGVLAKQVVRSTARCNPIVINEIERKLAEECGGVEMHFQSQCGEDVSNSSTASIVSGAEQRCSKRPLAPDTDINASHDLDCIDSKRAACNKSVSAPSGEYAEK